MKELFSQDLESPPIPNSELYKATRITRVVSHSELIDKKYGIDTVERLAFDADSEAFILTSQIRVRRKELKMTQAQLAKKLGVNKSYITRIESGNVDIRLSSFLRILKGLDLDLNTIQTYNRYEPKSSSNDGPIV